MKVQIQLKKWLLYSLGILTLSIGISLTIWTSVLGVSPWDALHLGLTYYLPLNYGQISQAVGLVAILLGMVLGVRPKFGTLINMISVGWIVNFFLVFFPVGLVSEITPLTVLIFSLGIALSGIGTGLYIAADMGIGPRDSIMTGLNRRFGIQIGLARTLLEVLVVGIGFLLSGPIGIGTILFSVSIGFFVQRTLRVTQRWTMVPFDVDKEKNSRTPVQIGE